MTRKNKIVTEVCNECGKTFDLGYAGLFLNGEIPTCDTCAGVERDADGNAWLPGETEITWEDGTVTTRAEAFAK